MAQFKRLSSILLASAACSTLAACGADDIASPGTGGNVTINNVTPAPTPTPTPTGPVLVVAAGACPTIADPQGLTDLGVISGPTGSYRNCALPALLRTSVSLTKQPGLVYSMNGRVNVGCDGGFTAPTVAAPVTSTTVGCTTPLTADTAVTLTIAPGVILIGNTGQSWLAVNRGNRINATGTATQPIIFTSRDNVAGFTTDSSIGQWGGVVLLGRGVTTDCVVGSVATNTCERDTEGAADLARFGGTDNTYNAGRMSFVQIRYSGFALAPNRELQSLTTGGTGTGTVLDHIQSHNSSDDGSEFFGGAVNIKYYIATGADDDSIDVDTGSQTNMQYALMIQRPGTGDALFEIDSNGFETDTPRTRLNVVNFTALQPLASSDNEANATASTFFRGNLDATIANGIIATPNNECIRLNGSGTTPVTLTARSTVLQCNAARYRGTGSISAAQVATFFGTGANNNNEAFTPTLTAGFINGTAETAVTAFDAATLNAFFDTTTWIGAVRNAADTWYAGWACNSGTANFGTTSTACSSLPTT